MWQQGLFGPRRCRASWRRIQVPLLFRLQQQYGENAGYLSVQMVENGLKLSEGMTISVPDQGDVVINANNLIYAAPMLDFVPDNIDNFNF